MGDTETSGGQAAGDVLALPDADLAAQLESAVNRVVAISEGKISRAKAMLAIIQRGLALTDSDYRRSSAAVQWMADHPTASWPSMDPEDMLAEWYRYWIGTDGLPVPPKLLQARTATFLTFKAHEAGEEPATPFDL